MKKYLFSLLIAHEGYDYHEESFECDADAMIRARKILAEAKRDHSNTLQIDLYRKVRKGFIHVVSYQ